MTDTLKQRAGVFDDYNRLGSIVFDPPSSLDETPYIITNGYYRDSDLYRLAASLEEESASQCQ